MTNTFDAVIVGAGIVGAACALALSREGMHVALVERGEVGAGATAAAMGHVVVMDDSPAQLALTRYSQQLWKQIAGELPPEAQYFQRGTLWLASTEEELEEIGRKQIAYIHHGIPCDVLDGPAVAQAEPALRPGLVGALLVTEDLVVVPQVAAQYLLHQSKTVTIVREEAVTVGNGHVSLRNGNQLNAPILINAAGEWASDLTPGLPVVKRKGHLAITTPHPGYLHYQVVELGYLKSAHSTHTDSVAFNVQPRTNGQLLIGSSRQYGVESSEVEPHMLAQIYERAQEFLPAISSFTIERTWTGFRSATPDKLPLIGRSAEDGTVFLATGHEGLGITTSLATAQLLADSITGKTPAIPIAPYAPSRTDWKR
jgi:glycine/D-amino acid oxidase-like deaminating enzyme